MDALFRHIDERLRHRKFCVVFDNELQRVWPVEKREWAKRAAAIEAFARAHGLTATIHDPGIRVTFRRAAAESESKTHGHKSPALAVPAMHPPVSCRAINR